MGGAHRVGMRLRWGRGREKEVEETTKPRPHTAFIAGAMKCAYFILL